MLHLIESGFLSARFSNFKSSKLSTLIAIEHIVYNNWKNGRKFWSSHCFKKSSFFYHLLYQFDVWDYYPHSSASKMRGRLQTIQFFSLSLILLLNYWFMTLFVIFTKLVLYMLTHVTEYNVHHPSCTFSSYYTKLNGVFRVIEINSEGS